MTARILFSAGDATHGYELWVTDGTAAGTHLVADINPGTYTSPGGASYPNSSSPSDLTAIGDGRVVFSAHDGANGTELWVTDGTAAGTHLVDDIRPGSYYGSYLYPNVPFGSNPSHITALGNGQAVFVANDGTNGYALWVTDGTTVGTHLIDGIDPQGSITALGNGQALFQATNGTNGYELWITDGTAGGTHMVADINSGAGGSYPNGITALGNGQALFQAFDSTYGDELWITDGTELGTHMIRDIYPGTYITYGGGSYPNSSLPHGFSSLGNGETVFAARDGTYGEELWVTDGTYGGTAIVKDIYPGTVGSSPSELTSLGDGEVLFSANDGIHGFEPWITDGTTGGTYMLADINGSGGSFAGDFTSLGNGRALFAANDGTNGTELWVTDGTTGGTYMLADINGSGGSYPYHITAIGNGEAVFSANDGTSGYELWITDGTTLGTHQVDDINTGAYSSYPTLFTVDPTTRILFSAYDGTHGYELWVTDGAAGTHMVADINPGSGSSNPLDLTALGNGEVLFAANDGTNGNELWVSDGTATGTQLVYYFNPGSYSGPFGPSPHPSQITALGNGTAVFVADDGTHGNELWVTDGTSAGTYMLNDINSGTHYDPFLGSAVPNSSRPYDITALGNGEALFQANDGTHGYELWITDGTAAGTTMLDDINHGAGNSYPSQITSFGNGQVLFRADDGTNGSELWITDGTELGTHMLADINPGSHFDYYGHIVGNSSRPSDITALGNGTALFTANDGTSGYELWITDGTELGTHMVADINPGVANSYPSRITSLGNGTALFSANDGTYGYELWVTDGTGAGTFRLTDINPAQYSSYPDDITPLGDGRALFAALDGAHVGELWVTNGTLGGTYRLDIPDGGYTPRYITAIGNGEAVFSVYTPTTGVELWTTNGTTAGTHIVHDIVSGSGSSNPAFFTLDPTCYCRGTRIMTDAGEVPVEDLAIGDRLVTLSGEARSIRWIGYRAYDGRFIAGNRKVMPIRIAAGALAEGVPSRDLWLSPEHSVHIDGVLVRAGHLVNGVTIAQADRVERLEYFHIELDSHDVIFADGAPAETYVDCDNRNMFQNAGEFAALYPEDVRPRWQFCLPRLEWDDPGLAPIRAALFARAAAFGDTLDGDPDLHLVVDGEVVHPDRATGCLYRFIIPAGSTAVRLVSRSTVPAEVEPESRDVRRLGVAIERLVLQDADLFVEAGHGHAALCDGFHEDEDTHRWTDGGARLPQALLRAFVDEVTLDVHLAPSELGYRVAAPTAYIAEAA
jgi:ELWxxDGT repeat protein